MAATGKSKTCVWRWQERFMAEGVDGLLREKTRPPGTPRTSDEKVGEAIRLTQEPPPHEATHWTIRAMGKAVGLAASTVREIWKAHGLSPHRWRQFKLSNDRAFAEKLHDVVGLYVSPPAHAVVLSVDEKAQIQALDRTQPGLPLKKGRGPTMTHDYKRNGTTTLFAALNVLDGSVIGQNMQRHRHQEFIRFLNQIERDVPKGKAIHVILDNSCTHKTFQSAGLAGTASALDVPLHPDIVILAERGGGVLRETDAAQAQTRRIPLGRRPAGRDQSLHRRTQHHRSQAVYLAHRPRGQSSPPETVGSKRCLHPAKPRPKSDRNYQMAATSPKRT